MSRPINPTKEMIDEAVKKITKDMAELRDRIGSGRLFDGKISYQKEYEWDKSSSPKAEVIFTPTAWGKMTSLVMKTPTEIGWNGIVEREGNSFIIKDIIVYPQSVSGATVSTDAEQFALWFSALPEETQNSLRFHGHSHVNMAPLPSSTDIADQKDIFNTLSGDEYYIFMIMNKSLDYTLRIYDLAENTIFEKEDITLTVNFEKGSLEDFINEASKKLAEGRGANKSSSYSKNTKAYDSWDYSNWGTKAGYRNSYYSPWEDEEVSSFGGFFDR